MLAKFQGVLFKVEKIEDMPGYKLFKGKELMGAIFLDTSMFMISTDPFTDGNTLMFPIDIKDFQLLDYDIVNSEWLSEIMELKKLSVKDISEFLGGTTESTIYRWKSGEQIIPGAAKASLFSLLTK